MTDISFWIFAGALSFGIGAVLLWAMARGAHAMQDEASAKALTLYRDQLAEIERDVARGTLSASDAAPLRTEVQRRILDTARQAVPAVGGRAWRMSPTLGFAVVCLGLAGGLALYLRLGAPAYPDLPLSKRLALAEAAYDNRPSQSQAEAAQPPALPAEVDAEFLALMERLRAAVQQRPDDLQGLTLLARNEAALGNFAAAARAYTTLAIVKGDAAGPEDHLAAAQAMIAAAGGQVSP